MDDAEVRRTATRDRDVWRLIDNLADEYKAPDTAAIGERVPPSRRKARHRALIRAWMVIARLSRGMDPDVVRRRLRPCAECQTEFSATRSDARYCSSTCRVKAYRSRQCKQL